MKNIFDLSYNTLEEIIIQEGYKKYRASQIWDWLYIKKVKSFESMSNLNKEIIAFLSNDFYFTSLELVKKNTSSDETIKYLFQTNDSNLIETVLMKNDYGYSICITSQIGCNMGCVFCASGQLKKVRNLSTGELVSQILMVEDIEGIRINSVVVMGIGEPFDNYDNLMQFLEIINQPKGLAIGARHITVSTSGIIPKIAIYGHFPLQVNLAISLHAASNEKRSKLMPINLRYPLEDLISAIKEYQDHCKRRVTIEYILINEVNDSISDAQALASLLKDLNVYVNLIPYNEVNNLEFKRSKIERRREFFDCLKKRGIDVTLRRELGTDINAACGQLRSISTKQ